MVGHKIGTDWNGREKRHFIAIQKAWRAEWKLALGEQGKTDDRDRGLKASYGVDR